MDDPRAHKHAQLEFNEEFMSTCNTLAVRYRMSRDPPTKILSFNLSGNSEEGDEKWKLQICKLDSLLKHPWCVFSPVVLSLRPCPEVPVSQTQEAVGLEPTTSVPRVHRSIDPHTPATGPGRM